MKFVAEMFRGLTIKRDHLQRVSYCTETALALYWGVHFFAIDG